MKKAYRIRVTGKVQNVGFRFYTIKAAKELNIQGFVRNEPDGSVYIEAEGEPADLETFTGWCRQGPAWARVEQLVVQEMPLMNFKGFHIR